MRMGIRASLIIFDIDGVLIDSGQSFSRSWSEAVGLTFGKESTHLEPPVHLIGHSLDSIQTKIFGFQDPRFEEEFRYQQSKWKGLDRLYPGTMNALLSIRALGLRLAVLSSRPPARLQDALELLGDGVFDTVLRPDLHGILPKPSGEGICWAMNFFQTRRDSTIMVGDSEQDRLASLDAGVNFFWCDWGYGGNFEGNHFQIISSLSDLTKRIQIDRNG